MPDEPEQLPGDPDQPVYDYGEGKTREQEADDSVEMLARVLALGLVVLVIVLLVALWKS